MIERSRIAPHKYIKICENSVRVKIERGDDVHLKHFPIRAYSSLLDAHDAALKWRDDTHLEHYGIPVLDKVVQIAPRNKTILAIDPSNGEKLPDLPTGLSYGFHRGRLLYVVASFQGDNKPKRERFSIKKLGLEAAIKKASEFRLAVVSEDT